MPLLKIQTNVAVNAGQADDLLVAMTDLVAERMNKPRDYVQVLLEPERAMQFAGTGEPNAFVELRAIGLREELARELAMALTDLIEDRLGVPRNRIFLNLLDVPRSRWGWDGATFG